MTPQLVDLPNNLKMTVGAGRDENDRLHALNAELLAALAPSDGGTAAFSDELEVVAGIIDKYDSSSGLGRHLRKRAIAIRAAIAKAKEIK